MSVRLSFFDTNWPVSLSVLIMFAPAFKCLHASIYPCSPPLDIARAFLKDAWHACVHSSHCLILHPRLECLRASINFPTAWNRVIEPVYSNQALIFNLSVPFLQTICLSLSICPPSPYQTSSLLTLFSPPFPTPSRSFKAPVFSLASTILAGPSSW